eukprot:Skav223972  [mRNA]  locus=scaffold1107:108751:126227:+ [translate_table: standard]
MDNRVAEALSLLRSSVQTVADARQRVAAELALTALDPILGARAGTLENRPAKRRRVLKDGEVGALSDAPLTGTKKQRSVTAKHKPVQVLPAPLPADAGFQTKVEVISDDDCDEGEGPHICLNSESGSMPRNDVKGSEKVFFCSSKGNAGRLYLLALVCHQKIFARGRGQGDGQEPPKVIHHFQCESYYRALLDAPPDKPLGFAWKGKGSVTSTAFQELENNNGRMNSKQYEPDPEAHDGPHDAASLFASHFRFVDKLFAADGIEGLERMRDNLSKVKVVSLFSGLGGAELAFHQAYLACTRKCEEVGINGPLLPQNVLACDCDDMCQRVLQTSANPPQNVVDDLMRFLSTSCVNRCRELCEQAGNRHGKLTKQIEKFKNEREKLKDTKDETSAKKNSKTGKNTKASLTKKIKELKEKEADARAEIDRIGQNLMVDLVNHISRNNNLLTRVRNLAGEEARILESDV